MCAFFNSEKKENKSEAVKKVGWQKTLYKVLCVVLAVFWAVGVLSLVTGTFQRRYIYPLKYKEYVAENAEIYGIPPDIVYGVMKAESGFKKKSVSKKNARGLMQITDGTAGFIAERLKMEKYDVYDPETNIKFGCWYLGYLFTRFGVTETALAAYNAGEGNVSDWLKNEEYSSDGLRLNKIPYGETDAYVKKVLRYAERYRRYYKM